MRAILIILLAAFFMLFTSCNEKQVTEFTQSDLEQIQQDTNWVEITDIDTVEACMANDFYNNGKGLLIKSEEDYKKYFDKSLENEQYMDMVRNWSQYTNCTEEFQPLNANLENRDLILYSISSGGMPIFTRRIFLNKNESEYIYIVEIQITTYTKELRSFSDEITVPNLNEGYSFRFETFEKQPE